MFLCFFVLLTYVINYTFILPSGNIDCKVTAWVLHWARGGGGGGAAYNGRLGGERSGFLYVEMQLCGTFIGVCPAWSQ
jgi:hypothetical protein